MSSKENFLIVEAVLLFAAALSLAFDAIMLSFIFILLALGGVAFSGWLDEMVGRYLDGIPTSARPVETFGDKPDRNDENENDS